MRESLCRGRIFIFCLGVFLSVFPSVFLTGCGGSEPDIAPSLALLDAREHLVSRPVSETEVVNLTQIDRQWIETYEREKEDWPILLRVQKLEFTDRLAGAMAEPGYMIGLLHLEIQDLRTGYSAESEPIELHLRNGLKLIDEKGKAYYPSFLNAHLAEAPSEPFFLNEGERANPVVVYLLPAGERFVGLEYIWNEARLDIPLVDPPSGTVYRELESAFGQTTQLKFAFHAMTVTNSFSDQTAPQGYRFLVLWSTIQNLSEQRLALNLKEMARVRSGSGMSYPLVSLPWSLALPLDLSLEPRETYDGTLIFLVQDQDESLTFHYDEAEERIRVTLVSEIPVEKGIPLVPPAASEISEIKVYGYGRPNDVVRPYEYEVQLGLRNLREDAIVRIDVPSQFYLELPDGRRILPLLTSKDTPGVWEDQVHVYPGEEERGRLIFALDPAETARLQAVESETMLLVFESANGVVKIPLL